MFLFFSGNFSEFRDKIEEGEDEDLKRLLPLRKQLRENLATYVEIYNSTTESVDDRNSQFCSNEYKLTNNAYQVNKKSPNFENANVFSLLSDKLFQDFYTGGGLDLVHNNQTSSGDKQDNIFETFLNKLNSSNSEFPKFRICPNSN